MFTNFVFDLILLAVLFVGAFMGYKNGFLFTVVKPVKFALALVLAITLASFVGEYMVEPIIGPAISHKLSDILFEKYSEITAATANESLPTLVKFAASLCGLNLSGITVTEEGMSIIEAVVNAVTEPVVDIIGTLFGFIIAYFGAKLLLGFGLNFLNTMIDGGMVGKANRILGSVFTFFLAFMAVWLITSVSEFILNIPIIASLKWVDGFSGGLVYRFFRSFTPLDLLLSF